MNAVKPRPVRARRVAVTTFALLLGVLAGALGLVPIPAVKVQWTLPRFQDEYVPIGRADAGDELVLVVIGSSGCGWSNEPAFRRAVRAARTIVQSASRDRGVGFATVGVAKDEVVQRGVEHLEWLGPFDEITTGRGWRNDGVLKYVYQDFPGQASTPQLLVMKRTLVHRGDEWSVEGARVLIRKVGLSSIERWVDVGAPFPFDRSSGP